MSLENDGDADGKSFMARMRHDLRTSLNPILGYSDILLEDAQEAGQADLVEILRNVYRTGEYILNRINVIMDRKRVDNDPNLKIANYEREVRVAIERDLEGVVSRCQLLESQPEVSEEFLADVAQIRQGLARLERNLNEMRDYGD
jgi:signal transduction histidine kinase